MTTTPPLIYAPRRAVQRLGFVQRVVALGIALACLAVLVTAVALVPHASGIGTHIALGMRPCGFEQRSGLPCATCGMTTSFSHFAKADFLSSAYVQPMGLVLAVLTGITFWASLYVALTARPVHRLLKILPVTRIVFCLLGFAALAWLWKIVLRLNGWDGHA